MPELPEVETVVRSLNKKIQGRILYGITNEWPRHLATHDVHEMSERVYGTRIIRVLRRGKYILIPLDSADTLIVHLRMTGQLLLQCSEAPVPDHTHTIFHLSDDVELRFRDVRKFGRVYLTSDPNLIVGELGPEPLAESFTSELLSEMLATRHRILKPLLLDQRFIAGIGNIYADEALHGAQLAPRRLSNSLTQSEATQLHSSIQRTLQSAIDNRGATINDYRQPDGTEGEMQNSFKVYGLEGEPCPRCNGIIERMVLGGRSTYFCPSCQI